MHISDKNIGRYMIGLGAVVELKGTNKILILKRNSKWLHGQWELMYGRIDQGEEFEQGLKREVREETGITDLKIRKLSRMWHIYRGEKSAENELFGFTFICETKTKNIRLSTEHTDYKWVEPEKAIRLIEIKGIRKDVELYLKRLNDNYQDIEYSSLSENIIKY